MWQSPDTSLQLMLFILGSQESCLFGKIKAAGSCHCCRDPSSVGQSSIVNVCQLSCLGDSAACAHVLSVCLVATRGAASVARKLQVGPSDTVESFHLRGVLVGHFMQKSCLCSQLHAALAFHCCWAPSKMVEIRLSMHAIKMSYIASRCQP